MDKKLKVAVIGLGRISSIHLNAYKNDNYATLTAVCDIKKDRADRISKEHNAKAYYDYKEMLDNEKLDAIHICLPHYLHIPVAKYAIEKGVNVLSEKPMSIDYESAVETVKLANEKGVLYGVILQNRYNPSTKFVKKALESGKLGKIISARSILTWYRTDEYYSNSDWNGTWDKEGGGVLINQAIHTLDLANYMIDCEFESVSANMANRNHKNIEVEDVFEGLITYKNGVRHAFYYTNNYGCSEPIEVKLYCEKGKVTFNYEKATIVYNDGKIEELNEPKEFVCIGGKDYWGNQHATQIFQFYKACLKLEELEITGEEALKTHKLVMALYEKAKNNYNKNY